MLGTGVGHGVVNVVSIGVHDEAGVAGGGVTGGAAGGAAGGDGGLWQPQILRAPGLSAPAAVFQ